MCERIHGLVSRLGALCCENSKAKRGAVHPVAIVAVA
jgi:hypothetical protein